MSPKHRPESPKEVRQKLLADGWVERAGRGDHINFNKPGVPVVITLDMGARDVTKGMLRSIYRKTGWKW